MSDKEWIAVGDRLPTNERVMVINDRGHIDLATCVIGVGTKVWGGLTRGFGDPTHWQPLPAPPVTGSEK